MAKSGSRSWSRLLEHYHSRGQYTFTREEIYDRELASPPAVRAGLRRLRESGRLVSPIRGFHVVVPPEYRSAGSPPPSWFIDDLMRFRQRPYYVGLLSAAALQGATHQQQMIFQVVTDEPLRPIEVGRSRIEFHTSRRIDSLPVIEMQTETGSMRVSAPETTAFDLVHYLGPAVPPSLALEALEELADSLNAKKLAQIADVYKTPDSQRLGFLLERLGAVELASALEAGLRGKRMRPIPLVPGETGLGSATESTWRVLPDRATET